MEKKSFCSLSLVFLFLLVLVVLGGCGKKNVEPGTFSSSMKPEGHQIPTPGQDTDVRNGNFAEGEFESLDESTGYLMSKNPDSEEYKATYGRSTKPLYPVYFDFDSSAIKPDQFANLISSSRYLLANQSASLVVEGNCDERGTVEYNLALGEVRAMNVKKHLVNLGIVDQRISTISFGAERPLYQGSNENDWARNRRVDLVLP